MPEFQRLVIWLHLDKKIIIITEKRRTNNLCKSIKQKENEKKSVQYQNNLIYKTFDSMCVRSAINTIISSSVSVGTSLIIVKGFP